MKDSALLIAGLAIDDHYTKYVVELVEHDLELLGDQLKMACFAAGLFQAVERDSRRGKRVGFAWHQELPPGVRPAGCVSTAAGTPVELTNATLAAELRKSTSVRLVRIDPDNLIDTSEVAALIGLDNPRGVSVYRRRYDDFPEPVVEKGRCVLWLRSDVEAWARARGRLS